MTGNNKVWRAPLAGLAAVAMLATMGVAAGTANAATNESGTDSSVAKYNFKVTFDANGGTVAGAKTKTVSTDDGTSEGNDLADGYLDYNSANNSLAGLVATKSSASGSKFTGWYTKPGADGVKFDPNTFINADTTLYAHYADPGKLVTLQFNSRGAGDTDDVSTTRNVIKNGFDAYNTTYVDYKAKTVNASAQILVSKDDNKVAAWELPVDYKGDSKVLTGWKTERSSVNVDGNVAVSADKLTSDLNEVLGYTHKGDDQTLKLAPVTTPAVSVKFHQGNNEDASFDPSYTVDVAYGQDIAVPTGEDAYNAAYNLRGTTYKEQAGNGQVVSGTLKASDSLKRNYSTGESSDDPNAWDVYATDAQQAFHVTYYTEINGKDVPFRQAIVDSGDSAPTDAPAARNNDDGSFSNYTATANPTTAFVHVYSDEAFSSAVSKNTLLAAQWVAKNVGVTFDLSYGDKEFTNKYEAGQEFDLPTASRDGWALAGWYYTTSSTSPTKYDTPFTSAKGGAEFKYSTITAASGMDDAKKGDVVRNNGTHTLDYFKRYQVPTGARLRINESGNLQWLNTKVPNGVDASTGNPVYKSEWVTIPSRLYAAWYASDKDQVQEGLDQFPTQDADKNEIDYSAYLKNWGEIRPELDAIQTELAKPGLTNEQAAALQTKLAATLAKVQVKTDQKVYRLYNKGNGDHYFTVNVNEYDKRVSQGLQGEGPRFQAVSVRTVEKAAAKGVNLKPYLTAIQSVYNPYSGEHLLVRSDEAAHLAELGWSWDNHGQTVFYAPNAGGEVPVYRLFNTYATGPAHVYTAADEFARLVKKGWTPDNDSKPEFTLDATK